MLGVLREEGERLWLQAGRQARAARVRRSPIAGDAEPGDLVLAEKAGRPPRITARVDRAARRSVRAAQLLADRDPQARHSRRLLARRRSTRPSAVAKQPLGEGREDLRHLPIVAIDPADARDHDDAVWADARRRSRPMPAAGRRSSRSPMSVFYVRPGSALDREARRARQLRLFPRPRRADAARDPVGGRLLAEGRARTARRWPAICRSARTGELKGWRFTRAVVRIAANIAYEDAQAAIDGSTAASTRRATC